MLSAKTKKHEQTMEIAFHIGANCTDEDRLLKSLLKNAEAFSSAGIKVPGPGKYRRLIRETIQNLNGAAPALETRDILLDAILDEVEAHRLVMSNSNFVCVPNRIFDNGVFYEQTEAKVRGLLDLFPQDQIEFFIAVVNPATFLPDVFAASKAGTLDTYLKGMHPVDIRWSDMIARIQMAAPNAKLTVWCNEDTPLIWAELIRALAGIDQTVRITGGFDLLANIMAPQGMNRFLNYMRQHPPQSQAQKRKIIAAFLDKYALDDQIEEVVDIPGMTGELIEQLTSIYDEDVARISQMPGIRFIHPD